MHDGRFLLGTRSLRKGSLRRETADTCLNHLYQFKKKKKWICWFPDPSLENGIQDWVSRKESVVCIFSISKTCLWAFGPYPMFRVFCWGLKSRVTEGGVWLVPLTARLWMMQFGEVCSNSLQVICPLSSSPLVQSTSGSVPGLENSLTEHWGWWWWLLWAFEPLVS